MVVPYLSVTNTQVQIKNKVLKNTYTLLSMTLLFSAATAAFAVVTHAPHPGLLLTLVGVYGLMYLTHALKDSESGLIAIFAFTGFMGYTLGPLLDATLMLSNGGTIITMSLGATGLIFLGLSGHVLTTKTNYDYLSGFLVIGMMVALLAMIGAWIFQIPALHLAVSGAFVLLSSGMILFQTSQLINGGERNYIMATISLYVSIYNLFVSLLHILRAFSGRRD